MDLSNLPTLAEMRSVRSAKQKHELTTRLDDKDQAKKLDEKRLVQFRKAVWLRDDGICRLCGKKVKRTLALDPLRGEVHHIRGRNVTPENRYNVACALLLCARCHSNVQDHRVKAPTP